jgi:FtsP/CotA-like multicopper oxidase with cupredoxin domain
MGACGAARAERTNKSLIASPRVANETAATKLDGWRSPVIPLCGPRFMRRSPARLTRRSFVSAGLALTLSGLERSPAAGAQASSAGGEQTWRAAPSRQRLRPQARAEAELWTFDGRTPGPALRLRHGEELRLKLVNETPRPLSLHWHGVRGPNAMDGVGGLTQEPVRPGATFDYRFLPPEPGTFLVRPCVLGGSAEPLERGLAAALVVEEPSVPQVDLDLVLLVDDWLVGEDGSLAPFGTPDQALGRLGSLVTVGGRPAPAEEVVQPGSRIRVRLLNACNARAMRLRFDGLRPYVAAIDGQPTDTFEPLKASVPFAPGNRYDFILDLPDETGATGAIMATVGSGIPLLTLRTEGDKREAAPGLMPLPPNKALPAAIRLQNATRKDVSIKGDPSAKPAWTINGAPGRVDKALASVKRGQPVVLALKNETPVVQPFHLHGHVFRLLHPFDDGWEPYFLDTVQVPENRTVRIAFNAENPGKWLLASTVMERFDAGLWTWIEVV